MLPLVGRLMTPSTVVVGAPAFTPTDLGASLLGWWSADRADLITQSGGLVSSWRDIVAAYDMTAAGSARPTYGATSWNSSSPGITFDGTANCLVLASQPFPAAANPSEIWAIVDQQSLTGDATNRVIVSYGDTGITARILRRSVVSAQNRVTSAIGNGAAALTADVSATNFFSRHVARVTVSATETAAYIDGTGGTPTAVVPATATARARIGATAAAAAGNFFLGIVRHVLVTGSLSAGQVTSMNAWGAGQL